METKKVIIDGVEYVPVALSGVPNRISIWYMHDNHTFSPLKGTLEQIIDQAKAHVLESSYGMLCAPILLHDDKEIRRLINSVHATKELGDIEKWKREIIDDPDATRLIATASFAH